MKRILALLLAVIMIISLAACGNDKADAPTEGENITEEFPVIVPEPTVVDKLPEYGDPWYAKDYWMATDGKTMVNFYIHYPNNITGRQDGDGLICGQGDQTMYVVGAQRLHSVPVESLDKLFPAYFESMESIYEDYYGFLFANFTPAITGSQPVTVGDYEMHKFTGQIEFDDGDGHHIHPFVIYGTRTKGNGAYVYWAVMDTSPDQSKGDLIESHAYNTARLFRED